MTAMQVGKRLLSLAAVVPTLALAASCTFPTPSKDYVCDDDTDCETGRVCSPAKYCVIESSMEDAGMPDTNMPDMMLPIDADPFAATRAACMAAGYTQETTTGNLYRIVNTVAPNWQAANDDCANDVPNATHLITVSNATELALVSTSYENYWIGWIDRPVEGTWHILTDEVPAINLVDHWGNGRPDGGNSENCSVWRDNVNGFDDVDCPQDRRYICECDGKPITKPFM